MTLKLISIILFCSLCIESHASDTESIIFGLLPIGCEADLNLENPPLFAADRHVTFYLYGANLKPNLPVGITNGKSCEYVQSSTYETKPYTRNHLAVLSITTPRTEHAILKKVPYYLCVMSHKGKWIYQGDTDAVTFYVYEPLLTPLIFVIVIVICFLISSLMSGLNIGLLSLDMNELNVIKNSGSKKEKKYARKIIPVRKNGTYLLCSIVITQTLCNAIATVCIDRFLSDFITVTISTLVIVVMCEILPQSLCTYFPLSIGARTIYITKLCMVLTTPASYPLSKILNFVLGKEFTFAVTRDRLKAMIEVIELPTNEGNIIKGALDLSHKKVEEVMTLIEDCFKLPLSAIMDFETIGSILTSGYSRIPIYDGDESNICHVFLTKDLALLDPGDKVPVKVLIQHTKYKCRYIPKGMTLDTLLVLFKDSRAHMVFVVDDVAPSDEKVINVIGLITFEDVIEEIFQSEINDETDFYSDNRSKRRLTGNSCQDELFSILSKNIGGNFNISENLKLATIQFLTSIDMFSTEHISSVVLLRLLSLNIFHTAPGRNLSQDNIYVQGVPADYFVMVIKGLMELQIGTEELKFEVLPFKYFGVEALQHGPTVTNRSISFTPDYTLRAVKRSLYLKLSKVMYDAAVLATKFERLKEVPDINVKSELYKYYQLLTEENSNARDQDIN